MRFAYFFRAMMAVAMLLGGSLVAFSQTATPQTATPLRGNVKLVGQDGQAAPVAAAIVDVYRMDSKGDFHTKTEKNGDWSIAAVPAEGVYLLLVSAPGAQADVKPGIKVQEASHNTVLKPGDGKRMTLDEARAILIKKNEEEKGKIANINETVNRTFKAGNEALTAKNYDEAIKQYDEGLVADPDQAALHTQKSIALRTRGVDHYNAWVKGNGAASQTTDAEKKKTIEAQASTEMENARKDFQASADSATKAVEIAKKEEPAADAAAQTAQNGRKVTALASLAEAMRLFVKTDPSQVDAGERAYREYIAAEPDAAKKAKAQRELAQMLFDAATDAKGFERAFNEYQKLLETSPDDPDALLRSGQALFNIGAFNNNDKAKYQEAANYLQRFVDKAPEGQLRTEAKELIETLKAQANVTPEKTAAPRRKRP